MNTLQQQLQSDINDPALRCVGDGAWCVIVGADACLSSISLARVHRPVVLTYSMLLTCACQKERMCALGSEAKVASLVADFIVKQPVSHLTTCCSSV